jgi:hypothetical protein
MKTSAFIATLLTFLMVILVLGAAVFFLWQGRQLLEGDVTSLSADIASANSTATAVRAYVDAREAALGTSEALRATSEEALATSQAELAGSQLTRDSISLSRATLAAQNATQEALLAPMATPYVAFAYPDQGTTVTANSSMQVVIAVAHPSGIDRLALDGLGNTVLLPGGSEPYRVYSHRVEPPLTPGDHIITATVTSRNKESASNTLQFTVVGAPGLGGTPQSSQWEQAFPDGLAAYWPRER